MVCVAGDNIEDVGVKLSPDKCSDDISLVIVIHSHPQHHQLRNVLRETWAKETNTTRRIFAVGLSDHDENIFSESQEHGDVLQVSLMRNHINIKSIR